jgi:hypothetical protein
MQKPEPGGSGVTAGAPFRAPCAGDRPSLRRHRRAVGVMASAAVA